MENSISTYEILLLLGSLQGLNLSLMLAIRKNGNLKGNRLIALLVFVFSIDAFSSFLYYSNLINQFPGLYHLSNPFFALIGPLLFLYVRALSSRKFVFRKRYIFFFFPFLGEFIYWFYYSIINTDTDLLYWWDIGVSLESFFLDVSFWALEILYHFIFIFFTLIILYRHRKNVKKEFSDLKGVSLRFLWILVFFIFLFLFLELLVIIFLLTGLDFSDYLYRPFYLILAILFYSIGYIGLRQARIFDYIKSDTGRTSSDQNDTIKYKRSSLKEKDAMELMEKLKKVMEVEKIYLQNNIKLTDLAEYMGISTNHLSQIINDKFGKNFYDFFNGYRIEEAKRLLNGTDVYQPTIIEVAFSSGFRSKSSFNKIFKEHTSMTPTQFRKSKR